MTRWRAGLSLVEILIGVAVLAAGLVPLFDFLGGSRGTLGSSKEAMLLEMRTSQALAEAVSLIGSGELVGLPDGEEEVLDVDEDGFKCELRVVRVPGKGLFRIRVKATGPERFLELATVVSDPLASMAGPAEEIPPPPPEEEH